MSNRIFVALDTPDLERARALAQKVRHHVGGVKLGLEFFCANGPAGIRAMEELGIHATPTLFVNDARHEGTLTAEAFDEIIIKLPA